MGNMWEAMMGRSDYGEYQRNFAQQLAARQSIYAQQQAFTSQPGQVMSYPQQMQMQAQPRPMAQWTPYPPPMPHRLREYLAAEERKPLTILEQLRQPSVNGLVMR